jgi:uncharacterized protein (DUF362 family)
METSSLRHDRGRRAFLKNASVAGFAGLILPRSLLAGSGNANSRVIIVDHSSATSGNTINASVVQQMTNSGIQSLAMISNVGEAWKVLLGSITLSTRIGIKVNCINSSMSTHTAVAYAVAASLRQMNIGGTLFPENNVIIFDRTTGELRNAGYTINSGTTGVRCFGTDSTGYGYTTQTYDVAGSAQRLSTILTNTVDILINVAVLKNHGDGGVTLCLKNHYGTCNSPGSLHGSNCDPFIAALNATLPIRAKQKVNIIDALYGIRSGGPSGAPQFVANRLIFSTDIVAADYQGRKLLADNGCTTTGVATHIDTAATVYGLGTNNPAMMDVVSIHNPAADVEPAGPVPAAAKLHQNFPNPFNPITHIRFSLDRASDVHLRVWDASGRLVAVLLDRPLASGEYTVPFDASLLASGTYLCELKAGDSVQSRKMTLLK